MVRILLLETSAATLSVALSEDGVVCASRLCEEPRQQASLTAPLVQEILAERGLRVQDCDAICVSKGPGSYTGLRVGVSTAKGLAFGASLPVIGIGTLDILVAGARKRLEGTPPAYIIPLVDARRMEVYTAVFGPDGARLSPVEARVIGPDAFAWELAEGPVLFTGDGALKCRDVISSPNARFEKAIPTAWDMAPLAHAAYQEKRFEDLAYFEPFYLKDFVATVSRKNLF